MDWTFGIGFGKITNLFDYEQPLDDFFIAGVDTGSTMMNLFSTLITLLSVGMIHLLIFSCYCRVRKRENPNWGWKILIYIFKMLTFGFYFRLIFETFIIMCLSSFLEINRWYIKESGTKFSSFISAVIMVIFIFATLIYVFIAWIISFKTKKPFLKKELFEGLKKNKNARFYPLMFLLRRWALWAVVACKYSIIISI